MKSVRVWTFSGLHFPAFRLNMERYSVADEYWKSRNTAELISSMVIESIPVECLRSLYLKESKH